MQKFAVVICAIAITGLASTSAMASGPTSSGGTASGTGGGGGGGTTSGGTASGGGGGGGGGGTTAPTDPTNPTPSSSAPALCGTLGIQIIASGPPPFLVGYFPEGGSVDTLQFTASNCGSQKVTYSVYGHDVTPVDPGCLGGLQAPMVYPTKIVSPGSTVVWTNTTLVLPGGTASGSICPNIRHTLEFDLYADATGTPTLVSVTDFLD